MCVLIFTLTLTSMPKKNRARSSHIEDILRAEKRIFHPFLSRSSLVHGKLSNMKWLLSRLTRSGGSDEYSHDTISQSDSDPQMISIEQNIFIATAEAIESICIDKNDPTLSLSLSVSPHSRVTFHWYQKNKIWTFFPLHAHEKSLFLIILNFLSLAFVDLSSLSNKSRNCEKSVSDCVKKKGWATFSHGDTFFSLSLSLVSSNVIKWRFLYNPFFSWWVLKNCPRRWFQQFITWEQNVLCFQFFFVMGNIKQSYMDRLTEWEMNS